LQQKRRRGPESRNRSRSANSLINCQPQRLLRQPPAPLQSNVAADVGDGQLRIWTSPTPETSIYGTPKMAEHGQILHSYHSWSLFSDSISTNCRVLILQRNFLAKSRLWFDGASGTLDSAGWLL
jgi:hypothetical protein